jgi:hypothetical protein
MTINIFRDSVGSSQPPESTSVYLQALWYDAKGNWDKAHTLVQDIETPDAAWIHAYLHRREGDTLNADYWYRRAGKVRPHTTLETEWEAIVAAFL